MVGPPLVDVDPYSPLHAKHQAVPPNIGPMVPAECGPQIRSPLVDVNPTTLPPTIFNVSP